MSASLADATSTEQAAKATALRGKEADAYAALKAETSSPIAAIYKPAAALEQGAGGGFLQTQSADTLRNIVQSKVSMNDADRDELTSSLSLSLEVLTIRQPAAKSQAS